MGESERERGMFPGLDEDRFWALVELAGRDFGTFSEALHGLDADALVAFAWRFEYLAGKLHAWEFHRDAHSEDDLEDLAAMVVARGRAFYEDVLANPSRMPDLPDADAPGLDVWFEAKQIYEDRQHEYLPEFDGG